MILDFLREFLKDTAASVMLPDLRIEDIAEILGTSELGTALENIKNINKNEEILKAIPSIEFEDKMMCGLSEVEMEITENRPIIAWISVSVDSREFVHSVVITGIDMEKHLIYYNDPIYGKKEEHIGKFMSMWEKVDRTLIKVKIGKREQRLLDEWIRMKEQRGEVSQ